MRNKSLNYLVLLVFAPVLILMGVLGFILPEGMSFTSGATPYNIFHIVSGAAGLLIVLSKSENFIRTFNILFGAIDLYQAVASFADLFPENYFRWTRADDALHIIIGIGLILVGVFGRKRQEASFAPRR